MLLANAFVDLVQTTKKRRFTRSSKTGADRDGRAMSLYVHPSRARFERDVEVHEACYWQWPDRGDERKPPHWHGTIGSCRCIVRQIN